MGLLGELKAGVPFFSPRYVGHMSSDLTMASLIGYFATLLYNPNNVAAEASPVTTRMELEVADQLARMMFQLLSEVWVMRAKAPTTPKTFHGDAKWSDTGELRYWSWCSNQGFANTPLAHSMPPRDTA